MIAGRYEPLEHDLARDLKLDRVVYLRWLASDDEVDDPRLSHPNVVRVFDLGEHEGRRFAAVEHVQGLPLRLLAPLPPDEAVAVGLQACRALASAHDLGLVHAGELLVRQDGVPKLSGFRPGTPGDDVQTLARALNEASPGLPPLEARTETALARELERARPTASTAPLPAAPPPRRPRRLPALVAAAAVVAIAVGLAAAFATGGGTPGRPPATTTIQPVPHAATAEQQARDLSAWLARYSR